MEQFLTDLAIEKLQTESPHCSEPQAYNSFIEYLGSDQAVSTELVYTFSCKGQKANSGKIPASFDSSTWAPSKGDGGLKASLGNRMQSWAQSQSMQKVVNDCGGLDKVETFELKEIISGELKIPGQAKCGKDAPLVLSPYDKNAKAKLSPSIKQVGSTNDNLAFSPFEQPSPFGKRENEPKNCKRRIKGEYCYGDCVIFGNDKADRFTLSTGQALSDNYEVCADTLDNFLIGKGYSASVKKFFCERYIIQNLRAKNSLGLSCASSRIIPNCK